MESKGDRRSSSPLAARELSAATLTSACRKIQMFPWNSVQGDMQRADDIEVLTSIAMAQTQAEHPIDSQATFAYAEELASDIREENKRPLALEAISLSEALGAFGAQAVKTARAILTPHKNRFPEIACPLTIREDKEDFKKLLIPSAYFPESAYGMCDLLVRLYPDQAKGIARFFHEIDSG